MAENTRKCDGKCMDCGAYQRQFCAAQLAYNNMRQLEVLSNEMKDISSKIEAMQNSEASIFDPNEEVADMPSLDDTAQEGGGAEE